MSELVRVCKSLQVFVVAGGLRRHSVWGWRMGDGGHWVAWDDSPIQKLSGNLGWRPFGRQGGLGWSSVGELNWAWLGFIFNRKEVVETKTQ